jgi:predicted Zn-dependent protease
MLAVTACASASTRAPKVSQDELRREQEAQYQMANQMKGKDDGKVAVITNSMADKFRTVANRVGVAGVDLCQQLKHKDCIFGFELQEDSILNAYADGKNIVVSSKMADFADYDELANVLSHEYSHNIMGHVASQTQNTTVGSIAGSLADMFASSQGVDTGGNLSKVGANVAAMHYSQDFEREADYVGLYVMQRAGYDITKAPNFWRKMSMADSSGIKDSGRYGSTHPSNPERYVSLNKTIAEIQAKKQNGAPMLPNFRQ